jgi:copper homeostasis protein
MSAKKYIIEIATSDFLTTKSAVKGGADRIELCAALTEGGTTPSYGTIKKCRESFSVLLYPIIRPRGGDFLYSQEEFDVMKADVQVCKDLNCHGVVVGLLLKDGQIDLDRTSKLIELAGPMGVTFHRAFDRCKDPEQALEQLIQIGCERVLTSGQVPSAPDGVQLIAALQKQAAGRIIVMPGSGVRASNIKMLADKTSCTEFHSSLRDKRKSEMSFVHPGFANSEESYTNNYIDPAAVKMLRASLEN